MGFVRGDMKRMGIIKSKLFLTRSKCVFFNTQDDIKLLVLVK